MAYRVRAVDSDHRESKLPSVLRHLNDSGFVTPPTCRKLAKDQFGTACRAKAANARARFAGLFRTGRLGSNQRPPACELTVGRSDGNRSEGNPCKSDHFYDRPASDLPGLSRAYLPKTCQRRVRLRPSGRSISGWPRPVAALPAARSRRETGPPVAQVVPMGLVTSSASYLAALVARPVVGADAEQSLLKL
jgi:hypothetical protein